MSLFEKDKIKNILVLMPHGTMGDLILSTPVYHNLKTEFPNACLVSMIKDSLVDILMGNPCIDTIVGIPPEFTRGSRKFKEQLKIIESGNYDIALAILPSWREARLLNKAKIPVRIGTAGNLFYSHMFTHRITNRCDIGDEESHMIEIMLDYIRVFGIEPKNMEMFFYIPDNSKTYVENLLKEMGIREDDFIIGLNIAMDIPATFIQWPIEKFALFYKELTSYFKAKVILSGTPRENDISEAIKDHIEGPFYSIIGQVDLKQMGAFIRKCDVFVSSVSGPLHIAASLKVPTVGIFARKIDFPHRYAPCNGDCEIIRLKEIPCRKKCKITGCKHFKCFEGIPDEMLIKATANLISRIMEKRNSEKNSRKLEIRV